MKTDGYTKRQLGDLISLLQAGELWCVAVKVTRVDGKEKRENRQCGCVTAKADETADQVRTLATRNGRWDWRVVGKADWPRKHVRKIDKKDRKKRSRPNISGNLRVRKETGTEFVDF
jgi:hypothetical protein